MPLAEILVLTIFFILGDRFVPDQKYESDPRHEVLQDARIRDDTQ